MSQARYSLSMTSGYNTVRFRCMLLYAFCGHADHCSVALCFATEKESVVSLKCSFYNSHKQTKYSNTTILLCASCSKVLDIRYSDICESESNYRKFTISLIPCIQVYNLFYVCGETIHAAEKAQRKVSFFLICICM